MSKLFQFILFVLISVTNAKAGDWQPVFFNFCSSPGGRFWNFDGSYHDYFFMIYDSQKNVFIKGNEIGLKKYIDFNAPEDYSENEKWASDGSYFYDTETWARKKIRFELLLDSSRFEVKRTWGSFKKNMYYSHVQCRDKQNEEISYAFFISDPETNLFIWQYGPDNTAYYQGNYSWNKFWVEGISQKYFYITDRIPGNDDSLRMILVNPFTDETIINTVIHKWLLGDDEKTFYVDSVLMVGSTEFEVFRFGKNKGYQIKRNNWVKQFDSAGTIFYIDRNNPKYFWGCDLWKYDPISDKHELVMKDIFFDEMLISKNGKYLAIPEIKFRKGHTTVYKYPEMTPVVSARDYLQWVTADPRYIVGPNGEFYVSPSKDGKKLLVVYPAESTKNKVIVIPF